MAKQKTNTIALEVDAFDKKIKEFQKYLDSKNINEIYDDTIRTKEIDIHLKIMSALPNLLEQLKKLRETDAIKMVEARGGAEVTGVMVDFLKNKQ